LSPEKSAFKLQTPGKFPEEYKLHSEHGESLKTIVIFVSSHVSYFSPWLWTRRTETLLV